MSKIDQQFTDESVSALSTESKARIWATLAAQHEAQRNAQRGNHIGKRLGAGMVLVVLFLIAGISGGFGATYTFAQEILVSVGHRIDINDGFQGIQTPAPISSIQTEVSVSIEEAQAQVPFQIMQPSYVPDGYTLTDTKLVASEVEGPIIKLVYSGSGGIQFLQSQPSIQLIVKVPESRIIEIVNINGSEAIFYDRGGPVLSKVLRWTDGVYWYELAGTTSLEELVKIAKSLR